MIRVHRLIGLFCLLSTTTARAHFVWLELAPAAGKGSAAAKVWFAEGPEPGSSDLLPQVAQAKLTAFDRYGGRVELEPPRLDGSESPPRSLVATLPNWPALCVEGECDYGLYVRGEKAIRLFYHAKRIHAETVADLPRLLGSGTQALELLPIADGDTTRIEVRWQGAPLAGAEVTCLPAAGDEAIMETAADGRVTLPTGAIGAGKEVYGVRVRFAVPDSGGQWKGKAFDMTWHVATLLLSCGGAGTGEASADELLATARQARAIWHDFPGCEARLVIRVDGVESTGTLSISPSGQPQVTGLSTADASWVEQQMRLLVTHRLPGTVEAEHAAFVDEPVLHPLGRLIRLEGDPADSAYRVRDHVITEVSRTMHGSRFTISVLDVCYNAEGRYLPRSYSVSYWNSETEQLKSNESYWHSWTRVDSYDLPAHLLIVLTGKGTRRVGEMFLDQYRLGTGQPAAPAETAEATAQAR